MENEILNNLKLFIETYKTESIIVLLSILLLIILYFFRSKSIVKKLIVEIINESEKYLNSETGQNKITFIETKLSEKIKLLPFYIRIFIEKFITRHYIVTIIEKVLNEIQDAFDPNAKDIDIKGNEEIKKKRIDIYKNENNKKIGINLERKTITEKIENNKEYNTEIYASLKAETDFHDNPEIKAEIGFRKRF